MCYANPEWGSAPLVVCARGGCGGVREGARRRGALPHHTFQPGASLWARLGSPTGRRQARCLLGQKWLGRSGGLGGSGFGWVGPTRRQHLYEPILAPLFSVVNFVIDSDCFISVSFGFRSLSFVTRRCSFVWLLTVTLAVIGVRQLAVAFREGEAV